MADEVDIAEAIARQATSFVDAGRLDLAAREAARAVTMAPTSAYAFAVQAIVLAMQKQRAAALAASDEALRLEPSNAYAHFARARVLGEDDFDLRGAGRAVREAIAIDPDEPIYHEHLAYVHTRNESFGKALAVADAALARFPENAFLHYIRGWSQMRLGMTKEAEASARRALAIRPTSRGALELLGMLTFTTGRTKEAAELSADLLRLNPSDTDARARYVESLSQSLPWFGRVVRFLSWSLLRSGQTAFLLVAATGLQISSIAFGVDAGPLFNIAVRVLFIAAFAAVFLGWVLTPIVHLYFSVRPRLRLALSARDIVVARTTGVILLSMIAMVVFGASGRVGVPAVVITFAALAFLAVLVAAFGRVRHPVLARQMAIGTALVIGGGLTIGVSIPLEAPTSISIGGMALIVGLFRSFRALAAIAKY